MPDRPAVEVQRIYELTAEDVAAHRVLVDRLWPRGVRKDDAPWDEWLRDVAPSSELRRWYGHEPSRFGEFAARYRAELARPPASEALAQLRERARAGPVLLITATRDVEHSAARVLEQRLKRSLSRRAGSRGADGP